MPPTRIPTEADFTSIYASHPTYNKSSSSTLPISLVFPNPPESTTAILLLFHGLGDSELPFATFARNLALPSVLAISVRGTAPLPALFSAPSDPTTSNTQGQGYHFGDDLAFSPSDDTLDPDPGFEKARAWVMDRLIGDVLVGKCGWEVADILLFGFGQGGGFALGLASSLHNVPRVVDITNSSSSSPNSSVGGSGEAQKKAFKGVVSIGGALPASMIPTVSGLGKTKTPALVCCGRESEAVDEDAEEVLQREFESVRVVRWKRADDGMPRDREEVLPMMQFFAERLRGGWL